MTTKRTRKVIIYYCDNPSCKTKHVVPTTDYKQAWPMAKKAGWICAKFKDKWYHFCDWVHRPPNDGQFQQMLDRPDVPFSLAIGKTDAV